MSRRDVTERNRKKPIGRKPRIAPDSRACAVRDRTSRAAACRSRRVRASRSRTTGRSPPVRRWRLSTPAISLASGTRTSATQPDRKSTRLNSSHVAISYAVFCLKKKKQKKNKFNNKKKKKKKKKNNKKEKLK